MSDSHDSSLKTIDYLADLRIKISVMYNGVPNATELGNIALEIIIKRNELHTVLEKNISKELKMRIDTQIKELGDLERIVTSMYMLNNSKMHNASNQWSSSYSTPKYTLWEGMSS